LLSDLVSGTRPAIRADDLSVDRYRKQPRTHHLPRPLPA